MSTICHTLDFLLFHWNGVIENAYVRELVVDKYIEYINHQFVDTSLLSLPLPIYKEEPKLYMSRVFKYILQKETFGEYYGEYALNYYSNAVLSDEDEKYKDFLFSIEKIVIFRTICFFKRYHKLVNGYVDHMNKHSCIVWDKIDLWEDSDRYTSRLHHSIYPTMKRGLEMLLIPI